MSLKDKMDLCPTALYFNRSADKEAEGRHFFQQPGVERTPLLEVHVSYVPMCTMCTLTHELHMQRTAVGSSWIHLAE